MLHSFHGSHASVFSCSVYLISSPLVLRAPWGTLLASFTEFYFALGLLCYGQVRLVSLLVSPCMSPCDKRNVKSSILIISLSMTGQLAAAAEAASR